VSDEKKMDKMIASSNLISCDPLEEDFVMDKNKIVIDIPIVLGFSVLQYAKLRMLECRGLLFMTFCTELYTFLVFTLALCYQSETYGSFNNKLQPKGIQLPLQ
jgi:hypothetical protein